MRFRDYLWHDEVRFIPLPTKLISAIGLIPHLKDENRSAHKRVSHASVPSVSMGSVIPPPLRSLPFSFGGGGFPEYFKGYEVNSPTRMDTEGLEIIDKPVFPNCLGGVGNGLPFVGHTDGSLEVNRRV